MAYISIDISNDQRLHLEFIQRAITRLGSKGFKLKGWSITIVSAFLAIYAEKANPIFLYIAIAPTIIFWFLNARYLQHSRQFRRLYDEIINNNNEVSPYSMNIKKYNDGNCNYWKSLLCSWSVAGLYASLIILLIAIGLLTNCIFKQ